MDLRELRTFRAVADLGSLSRAAGYLHVAQPALSRHIKQLEAEVHKTLFTRDGRGMRMTPAGEYLFERTTGLIAGLEHLRDDVRSFEAPPEGVVMLGLVPTVSALLAPDVVTRVRDEFPGISLRLSDAYSGHLADWMNRGDVDLAVMYGNLLGADYSREVLVEERLCAIGTPDVLPHDGAVAGASAADLRLVDLLELPLILPSESHPLRGIIEKAALRRDRELSITVEADSYRLLLQLAAAGHGVAVLPRYALETMKSGSDVHVRELAGAPLTRSIEIVQPRSLHDSVAVQAVAGIVRDEVVHRLS